MPAKRKNKNRILSKIMSYAIIVLSLFVIFLSYKYNLINYFYYEDIKNNGSLVSLYAKNQSAQKNEVTNKVAIKNGCGKKHLGLIYKQYLLNLGYDVTETTNAIHPNGNLHFGHSATKIIFHKKNKESAIYLSNVLGIKQSQIFEDQKETNFEDLTLILGQNYINLKSYKVAENFNPFNYGKK